MSRQKLNLPQSPAQLEQNAVRVFPGVRGKANKAIRINDNVTIPRDQEIIIQPLNANKQNEPQRYRLTLIERVKSQSGLPESQRDIKPGESYEVILNNPKGNFNFVEHLQLSNKPLFAKNNSPSLAEIQQGKIPDCFLLAAIQAILNHPDGSTFIRGMMTPHADGTVTVRLFDPIRKEPEYIKIDKAILVDKQGPLNKHPALWVHILEQAYSAMGKRCDGSVERSASTVFSGGGLISFAMSILTGLKEKQLLLLQQNEIVRFNEDEINAIKGLLETAKLDPAKEKKFKETLSKKLENFSAIQDTNLSDEKQKEQAYEDCISWYFFYISNKNECDTIINTDQPEADKFFQLSSLAGEKNQENVERILINILNYHNVPVAEKTIRRRAPAFSGYYAEEDFRCYEAIKQGLENGQLITAGTIKKFTKPVPGLRNQHAYTVLDVYSRLEKTTVSDTQEEITREVYYVQLRNPWGSTGRVYQQKEGTLEFSPIEDRNADIFEIELTDFCDNFEYVSISASANQLFMHDKQRLEQIESINKLLKSFRISTKTTMEELVVFQEKHHRYEEKLLELEQLPFANLPDDIKKNIDDAYDVIISLDMPEENKNQMIKGLLFSNNISKFFYAGDEEQSSTQLAHVLKLNWLKKQIPLDKLAIQTTKSAIIDNAGYEFCSIMAEEKLKMDIMANGYAKECLKEISQIKTEIAITKLKLMNDSKPDSLDPIFKELQKLKGHYARILATRAWLNHLNTTLDEEELEEILLQIEYIEELLATKDDYEALNKQHAHEVAQMLVEATNVYKAGLISSSQLHQIETIGTELGVNLNTEDELKKLAEELKHSKDKPKQELGDKLLAVLNTFIRIKNFIADTSNRVLDLITFQEKNSYFIPAEGSIDEDEESDQESKTYRV